VLLQNFNYSIKTSYNHPMGRILNFYTFLFVLGLHFHPMFSPILSGTMSHSSMEIKHNPQTYTKYENNYKPMELQGPSFSRPSFTQYHIHKVFLNQQLKFFNKINGILQPRTQHETYLLATSIPTSKFQDFINNLSLLYEKYTFQ